MNASGNATISLGPTRSRDSWKIDRISVTCTTNTLEATCEIYVGIGVAQSTFVDSTFTGSSGDTSDAVGKVIRAGENIFAVFTGGDIGATATVNVYGTKVVQ